MFRQPVDHGAEVEGRCASPVRQGAAVDLDAGAGKDLALSVKRQVVRELGHQDMCDGPFGRQPAFEQPGCGDSLNDPIRADAAGILRPDVDQHPKLRRHDVQPLGPILADLVHAAAATRALKARRFDDTLDARQVRGQMAEIALPFLSRGLGGGGGLLPAGLDLGDGDFQVFEGKLPVVITQLLGPFAMHDMVQLGHEMLEPPVGFLQGTVFLQHRQNGGALALGDRGPSEGVFFQPFVGHHESAAVPEQDLQPVGALRPEHEDRARERILGKRRLDQRRETVMPLPEVDRLRRHQDPHALRGHQHGCTSSAWAISAIRAAGASWASSITTAPRMILIGAACDATSGPASPSATSQKTRGAKTGSSTSAAGSTSLPCLASRRHAES